ncbi:MAG: DUF488 family protein [Nitrospira sp. CR1.3]|nr:DUF488 family protein [Nitrospira sp. CR1.3]
MTSSCVLWTIGHSTRPIDAFIDALRAREVELLIDVRTIPRSHHNPQFNTEVLAGSLKNAGLTYMHMPSLGGLRRPRKDSINGGWRNTSFRGYADYMQTDGFGKALEEIMAAGKKLRTAAMCAEMVPWRCHRSLIADALVSRNWSVFHIMSPDEAPPHRLSSFAKIEGSVLTYPKPVDSTGYPQLF